ncbi:MAG TPA: hypothetical protein PLT92_11095 [Ignavibacteriaceae bacterium]|nr:hypothetical protein [Ignavibacteriaceae bacterium]
MRLIFTLSLLCVLTPHLFSQSDWFGLSPKPQGNILYSSFFYNSSYGWACGADGTIIKSTD